MRFLEEHELPEWERKRRAPIIDLIEFYQGEIAKEWKAAEPHLTRLVMEGRYAQERHYRASIIERTDLINREIIALKNLLPPFLMCREDEILERLPAAPLNSP